MRSGGGNTDTDFASSLCVLAGDRWEGKGMMNGIKSHGWDWIELNWFDDGWEITILMVGWLLVGTYDMMRTIWLYLWYDKQWFWFFPRKKLCFFERLRECWWSCCCAVIISINMGRGGYIHDGDVWNDVGIRSLGKWDVMMIWWVNGESVVGIWYFWDGENFWDSLAATQAHNCAWMMFSNLLCILRARYLNQFMFH